MKPLDALRQYLTELGSCLEIAESGLVIGGGQPYEGARFAQVYPDSQAKRRVDVCFQHGRLAVGRAQTAVSPELAKALVAWIDNRVKVMPMIRQFPFVTIDADIEPTQADLRRYVEAHWLEFYPSYLYVDLRPFLQAASRHPVLRQLYWATSLFAFYFSRSPGLPQGNDCPGVERISPLRSLSIPYHGLSRDEYRRIRTLSIQEAGSGIDKQAYIDQFNSHGMVSPEAWERLRRYSPAYYVVFDSESRYLGTVEVPDAIRMVVDALPPGCVQDGAVRYL